MTLSEKEVRINVSQFLTKYRSYYPKKDVRTFIKELKEDIVLIWTSKESRHSRAIRVAKILDNIDSRAGEELI